MVNELGNTLGGMAVAIDYRATRIALFVYFRNGVKATWFRIVFFGISLSRHQSFGRIVDGKCIF